MVNDVIIYFFNPTDQYSGNLNYSSYINIYNKKLQKKIQDKLTHFPINRYNRFKIKKNLT